MLLLYSDGVSEATSPAGTELGRVGLMELVRAMYVSSPDALGGRLVSALRASREDGAPQDYQTIVVMTKNDVSAVPNLTVPTTRMTTALSESSCAHPRKPRKLASERRGTRQERAPGPLDAATELVSAHHEHGPV